LGVWLLEHAPYDNRYYSFENLGYDGMACWATTKFLVYSFVKTPFTHIDGDVIIKSQRMFDEITDKEYDLIVEGCMDDTKDDTYFTRWHKDYFQKYTDIANEFDFTKTCNCGCVTINNEQLKNDYVAKYMAYRDNILSTPERIHKTQEFTTFVPDLMIEQMNLYEISKPYKRKGLVNVFTGINDADAYNVFKPLYSNEYRHYVGREKSYISIEYFKNMLKQLDPELYEKTREKENEILKYLL
jgi:hypothetical protein